MRAEIIAIGSELLTPYRLDTNSLLLTERLNRLGVEVCRKVVVGDDRQSLDAALRCALGSDGGADILILMGGLGPTEDDRTREATAAAIGRGLHLNPEIAERLRARFRARGIEMPEINLRQAMILDGAEALANPKGTAPGQWIQEDSRYILLLPGPPHELEAVFDAHCLPRLQRICPPRHLVTRVLKIAGMFESHVDQIAAPIYRKYSNPETGILAANGEIQLHLRAHGSSEEEARQVADELAGKLKAALGDGVYAEVDETMEEVVGRLLILRRATLAVAESCTGGWIGQRLTRVPGSSAYFLGGLITYSNEAKMRFLDVPRRVLESEGAVSAETARIMAEGVRRAFGATTGLAVTGIAGPAAPNSTKPVGLVYMAVADDRGHQVLERQFPGDRERVRIFSSLLTLDLLRRRLLTADERR